MDTRASVITPCFGIAAAIVDKTVVDRSARRPCVVEPGRTGARVDAVSSTHTCRVAFACAVVILARVG